MKYKSKSVEETYKIAKDLAKTLTGGEVVLLNGELGAGKTTFTKGLALSLGINETVTSPTFTIMRVYEDGKLPLYHFDMYRIENEDDLYELGFEHYIFGNGVSVIEWNKLTDLPNKVITVNIARIRDTEREFEIL
jgi:tRNA threonylcarbamoyladenosine biosynthesis protein TsaE